MKTIDPIWKLLLAIGSANEARIQWVEADGRCQLKVAICDCDSFTFKGLWCFRFGFK